MSQLSQFRDWNCDSCKILEILAMSYGKIATFATAQFFNYAVDELTFGQWDCWQNAHQ